MTSFLAHAAKFVLFQDAKKPPPIKWRGETNMKIIFRIIRQQILWTALFTVIALWQASAQVKVRGTPMENVDLSHASIEEIHQVAEKLSCRGKDWDPR
jgi:hypothetical protein